MLIKNMMTKDVIVIEQERNITEAKNIMTKNGISKLPVVDKSGSLVGIITKNDLLKAGPSGATTLDMYEIGYLLSKLTVSKVMNKKVITVDENEVVEEAARILVDKQIGCVPVMKNGLLTGIITESDLFHLFTEMFGARQKGVRFVLSLEDKPGQLIDLLTKIAAINGNLISLVTRDCSDSEQGNRRITLKVTNVTKEQIEKILDTAVMHAEDIRLI